MPTITQLVATTYNEIVKDREGKAHNQWEESAFLREAERQKMVMRKPGGAQLEFPIDWRKNPGTDILATDFTQTAVTKTDALTAAQYNWAELVVPMNYSFGDEARNQGRNEKIDLVKALITNGMNSHDDEIETAVFGTVTDGLLGLQNLVPDTGQPNVGGIDGSVDAFWRNVVDTYLADGSDIDAAMTTAWNEAAKGSGSTLAPTLVVSDGPTQALFESGLQDQQRFIDEDEFKRGAKILAFKTARYVFTHKANERIYMLSPRAFRLCVSTGAFRALKGAVQHTDRAATNQKIFTMLQATTSNPSRTAVLTRAT